jgi:hypothetical protein
MNCHTQVAVIFLDLTQVAVYCHTQVAFMKLFFKGYYKLSPILYDATYLDSF